MDAVILLWDAASLWGLLAWQALHAFNVPCRLVKGKNIAHTLQSDKPRLLMVPGGAARRKFEALGPEGTEAVRAFVRDGGQYLGFCGGAGLGLSGEAGLALCPWRRAGFTDRLQHLISGQTAVTVASHALVPPDIAHVAPLHLPVWWPGRFQPAPALASSRASGTPHVLAAYQGPGPDLHMVDLPLSALPATVREHWRTMYNVSLIPDTLQGDPCVIHGAFGQGGYTLSYSHLETPASPEANRWLAHLLRQLAHVAPVTDTLPPWQPDAAPVRWEELAVLADRVDTLMNLGRFHGLFFERTPWLIGWKNGLPGAALNSLRLALRTLAATQPTPEARIRWNEASERFAKIFELLYHGSEEMLLAWRLAATLPEAVPVAMLTEQRHELFGSAMHGGGLLQELIDILDDILFMALQER